jgi:hypothetical protein
MESNRLTVIVDDLAVYRDQAVFLQLDLSQCGIADDIHALQWLNGKGHIEYRDTRPNLEITELPEWALKCIEKWEEAYVDYVASQGLNEETPTE